MRTFIINGTPLEFDETLQYNDFWLEAGQPKTMTVDMLNMLTLLESGICSWDDLKEGCRLASRWVHEAPRKRYYREMILAGASVISDEYFFDTQDGDKFIDGLENTGKLAEKMCRAFGVNPMNPIINHFSDPIPIDKLHKHEAPQE